MHIELALDIFITNRDQKSTCCLIDCIKKTSLPIVMSLMDDAVEEEDIDLIEYLCQSGCNSFPVELYGRSLSKNLHEILLRSNRAELYSLIIID